MTRTLELGFCVNGLEHCGHINYNAVYVAGQSFHVISGIRDRLCQGVYNSWKSWKSPGIY